MIKHTLSKFELQACGKILIKLIFLEVNARRTRCRLSNKVFASLKHLICQTFILAKLAHLVHEIVYLVDPNFDNFMRCPKLLVTEDLV